MNRNELAHLWTNQTDEELTRGRSAQASNARFEGAAFWHYATVISRIYRREDGRRLVLLDSARFSSRTSQVQCALRRAERASDVNVSLGFGRRGQSLQLTPKQIWESAIAECHDFAEQASKARGRAPYLLECARGSVVKAETVREFFKLRNKPFAPDLSRLMEHAKTQAAQRVEFEKRAADRKEKAFKTYGPRLLALWRAHEEGGPEWQIQSEGMKKAGNSGLAVGRLISTPGFEANAALRLSINRERVETSNHAQVLVRTVRFLWAFCRSAKANGAAVDAGAVARFPRLDNYHVNAIDAGGNLTAGCHRIPFAEVEGIARELGLPPFDGSPAEAPTIPAADWEGAPLASAIETEGAQ